MTKGIKGWLWLYLIGYITILMVYSLALSGWFFEYPFILMVGIFIILASPLVLIITKSSQAPRWNIFMWRTVVVLMALRSISIFLEPGGKEMSLNEMLSLSLTLLFILSISLAWTILWTKYFNKSIHVKNTFV